MTDRHEPRRGFHLLDIVALVIGYSLASMLVRAFWPAAGEEPGPVVLFVLTLAFVWLGLAMSGPIVLLGHRPVGLPGDRAADPDAGDPEVPEPRTWAELAWLIIGFYWIVLTVLVVPVRLHETRVLDSAFLGLFPVLAAVGLRFFRPAWVVARTGDRRWTHHAAVVLLWSWPAAWVALILLGKSLP